jgi:hypothetical protein
MGAVIAGLGAIVVVREFGRQPAESVLRAALAADRMDFPSASATAPTAAPEPPATASHVFTIDDRKKFAFLLDRDLLDAHQDPQKVEASGAELKVLRIQMLGCSRQWLYDFAHTDDYRAALKVGFTLVLCNDGFGHEYKATGSPDVLPSAMSPQ